MQKKFHNISLKLGFSIPPNVFRPGLPILHYGTTIVNSSANVGCNCRLHAGVTIGANAGSLKSPSIGDNCYIGSGAKVFGDIVISDNVVVGANSVVSKSITESNIAVAGAPAKKLNTSLILKMWCYLQQMVSEKELKLILFLILKI